MHAATLRLFSAVQINSVGKDSRGNAEPDGKLLQTTIPNGFILDPRISPELELLETITKLVGLSGERANSSFHKSWEKVRSADIEQLVLEQILHYITTYGFSEIGIYEPSTVYIPNEKLELPSIEDDIPITFVRGLTSTELLAEIVKLGSGIALHEKTLRDIMTIVKSNSFDANFLDEIRNFELLARLYEHYDRVPEKPVDFLRYLIFRLTDSSLLIKNDELIEKIKTCKPDKRALLDELVPAAPENLASIFYRFKPLFLAMKSISGNNNFFNRLRKKAVKLHQPLPVDYLNSITEQIKNGKLDFDTLRDRVANASVFRKIRLAHALNFRLHAQNSIVYRIRNGMGWATSFDWPGKLEPQVSRALEIVLGSLVENIRPQVDGRTVLIPSYVNYALPSSEKQFAGAFPSGSYVTTSSDTIFGIHWFNNGERTIDLDLSLLSAKGKIGWDAAFRSETALFSGDITDAPPPNGATELFYVENGIAPHLVNCNYYNFSSSYPVDAKIVVAKEAPEKLTESYMVDRSKIVATANIQITRKQTTLGLVVTVDGQTRFYFGNVAVGCSITSEESPSATDARSFLTTDFTNSIDLKTTLVRAGANVVEGPTDGDYVDLSPASLTRSSIVDLFQSTS